MTLGGEDEHKKGATSKLGGTFKGGMVQR